MRTHQAQVFSRQAPVPSFSRVTHEDGAGKRPPSRTSTLGSLMGCGHGAKCPRWCELVVLVSLGFAPTTKPSVKKRDVVKHGCTVGHFP